MAMSENLDLRGLCPRLTILLTFLACYVLVALFLQVTSGIPVHSDSSPLDYFTAGILWMLSLVCLLNGEKHRSSRWQSVFWLASCAALALLAIDEKFAFHERTGSLVGDDDHIKLVAWLAAGAVLYLICLMEDPPLQARRAIVVGYILHSLYILVEVGDGDYFQLPFVSKRYLHASEDSFELLSMASYLVAFIIIYTSRIILPPDKSSDSLPFT